MSTVEAMLSMAFPVTVGSQRLSARRLTRIQAARYIAPIAQNEWKESARSAPPTAPTIAMNATRPCVMDSPGDDGGAR